MAYRAPQGNQGAIGPSSINTGSKDYIAYYPVNGVTISSTNTASASFFIDNINTQNSVLVFKAPERTNTNPHFIIDTYTKIAGAGGAKMDFRMAGQKIVGLRTAFNPGTLYIDLLQSGVSATQSNEVLSIEGNTRTMTITSGNSGQK